MTNAIDVSDQREEQEALAFFGVRKFNSKRFENSDEDSVMVSSPVRSNKRDEAFAALCQVIPLEDALPFEDR